MTDWLNKTHVGDCRDLLTSMAGDGIRARTCVTSPPYFGLRDYGMGQQIGLESTPAAYVQQLVQVFRAVREVLADDGTLWLNLGDSYSSNAATGRKIGGESFRGSDTPTLNTDQQCRVSYRGQGVKPKDLIGIPWSVAFALRDDGWYLRSDIIWHKPNPMPESVTDRPTKTHEYVFLLAKSARYYFDHNSVREPHSRDWWTEKVGGPKGNPDRNDSGGRQRSRETAGRNIRSVWSVASEPFSGAHFACFPRALIEPCIIAGCPPGGTVLDPFMGSGTTGQVSTDLGRNYIGCELNPAYIALHEMRSTTIGMPL